LHHFSVTIITLSHSIVFSTNILSQHTYLNQGLDGLHHVADEMLLHLRRVVRVGQVAHVQSAPRRRLLQVGRVVAHIRRLLGQQIIKIIGKACHVREKRRPAAEIAVEQAVKDLEVGLKRTFSFSYFAYFFAFCEKAYENLRFRESFCKKFCFRENFQLREIVRKSFPFKMWIWIQEPPKCVSRSETLVENFRKNKLFAKTIPRTKFFRENFRKNEKFAKFRKNQNYRLFRFLRK
jgi:hypothetical protein